MIIITIIINTNDDINNNNLISQVMALFYMLIQSKQLRASHHLLVNSYKFTVLQIDKFYTVVKKDFKLNYNFFFIVNFGLVPHMKSSTCQGA